MPLSAVPDRQALLPFGEAGRSWPYRARPALLPLHPPQIAWEKLKALLLEDPALAPLAQLKRRTFLPAEIAKIYASLGCP